MCVQHVVRMGEPRIYEKKNVHSQCALSTPRILADHRLTSENGILTVHDDNDASSLDCQLTNRT